jgi:D-alanyl-D-alanine carboxypeptidase/D-alanyl-D-alanine-endopeptidase (penicillin-binding protein 4)
MKTTSIVLWLCCLSAASSAWARSGLDQSLKSHIDRCLKQRLYASVNTGIAVSSLGNSQVVYARNAETPYITASAAKIFVSAIALSKFGPDYQFKTQLLTDGEITGGVLKGNLYLLGQGDPCLSFADLETASRALQTQGIQEIQGDILFDLSYLDEEENRYAPNARNLYAPVCALTVNFGWIDVGMNASNPAKLWLIPETAYAQLDYKVKMSHKPGWGRPNMTFRPCPWGDQFSIQGTIAESDRQFHYVWLAASRPGFYAATVFRETLGRMAVRVTGQVKPGSLPANAHTLCQLASPPMHEIVERLNQESNNVIAETLNKDMGAAFLSQPGTREKGLQVMQQVLIDTLGFLPEHFSLKDASGLSPEDKIPAMYFVKALDHFYQDPAIRKAFISSLVRQGFHPHASHPVPPQGMSIFVKSGTLSVSGSNTLVGYIFLEKPEEAYSFALLANRRTPGGAMTYSGTLTLPLLQAVIDAFKDYAGIGE